ncbi:phage tail protein [Pseudomonas putida]|uniref:phage tail assembly chaperone n=1 Tax=Pseudomonas putida TaxID=303 RepID=UPI000A10FCD4|nr:phage tail assembly chaperone [Pseudomonas putida]ORL70321.1 phage tail protein [Pseudomonas putida]
MTHYYFSPSRVAFYPAALRKVYEVTDEGWPGDAIPVESETYAKLMMGLEQGQQLCADVFGRPTTRQPDPPTVEELTAIERAWRDRQLNATDALVSRHRDELELGNTTLTAEQYQQLQEFRRQLRDWPELTPFPSPAGRPVMPDWLQGQALKWNVEAMPA